MLRIAPLVIAVVLQTGKSEPGFTQRFNGKDFEIQVNNTYARDPVKSGSLYHISDITEAPAKDDEWFTEHIIVKDDTVTIRVNDKQVVQWTQTKEWAADPHQAL